MRVTRPSSFEASRFAGFRSLTSRINRADPASRICPVRISSAAERRGLLTGPAYVNVDVSIVKILRFGQRRLEVRADMFNALNIPHYANPNGTLGNGNFGRITEIIAQTERLIRFGGRFLFQRVRPPGRPAVTSQGASHFPWLAPFY